MSRGLNEVIVSGNCSDSAQYHTTDNGTPCATFKLASDRKGANKGEIMTTWVKINVYNEPLVKLCESRLQKGVYVIVKGELMNRKGIHGEVIEVRARELIFTED
jgi:single-stranded DNA-binding protein